METKVFLEKVVDRSAIHILRLHEALNGDDADHADEEEMSDTLREEILLMERGLTREELDEIDVNVRTALGENDRPRTLRLGTTILGHLLEMVEHQNIMTLTRSGLHEAAHEALTDGIREEVGLWSPDHDAFVAGAVKALIESMLAIANEERGVKLVHHGKHYLLTTVGPNVIVSKF